MPDTVGKTSKIAIGLNHYLTHSGVAISQQTQCLVSGFFECISLGFQIFSGQAGHLEIFKVVQKSSSYSRLDTKAQLTPLVGRKTEIAALMALWNKAKQGTGHSVLVRGEAGIGKSRLVYAIKERLAGKPHAIRELHCFPEFSQSPFHPLITMIEGVIGLTHYDAPEVKFAKVAAYVETHYPDLMQDAVPILTQLLSLSLCERYQPPDFSPQKKKELTIAILLDLLKALSLQQPVLFIVEDLHWIDPSSLELLTLLVEWEEKGAVLVILTARPEFIPPWNETLNSALALEPLSESETAEIITSFNTNISTETIRRIVERTDGIPLFAEEITKIAIQYTQTSIPTTLHDLLAMRLDNMGEAKYTAQLAATIGREFDINLLRMISPHDLALFHRTLNALQNAGLLLRVNEMTYQFKHALIQETAYQSQTKADRQATHQRIAQALQSDFPDVAAMQPELLAQHLFSSGESYQAIEYWVKAGQRAARNSANLEAIDHFNSGLQLLTTLPSGQARDKTEFNILVSLCLVLSAVKGYGSEEARQTNARISVLSETVGDSPELFQAKWFLVMNTIANAGSRDVQGAAMQLLNMAQTDPLKKQAAHYIVAKSAFWLGQFELTHRHAEQGIALYHPNQLPMLLEQFGEDMSVSNGVYLAWALYFLGYPERAQRVCEQTLKQARELGHPHTLGLALCTTALIYRSLNKHLETLSLSAEAIAIARQYGFPVWLAVGEMAHGWALVMLGQEEGIAKLKSSITGMRAAIGGISVVFLSALIEAYVHLNWLNQALDLIAEALTDAANTGDGHFTAELHRLKGICLLQTVEPDMQAAEACFNKAIAISRKQHSKSLELRAATGMARLWRQQGKHEDARRIVENIYNQFTEGFDTLELQEAAHLIRRESIVEFGQE